MHRQRSARQSVKALPFFLFLALVLNEMQSLVIGIVSLLDRDLSTEIRKILLHIDYHKYLYFLPLILIASTNLWSGVALHFSAIETVLYMISMICVGFIEEIIFRGFLFKALCKDNVKQAIIISSVTFGLGHIVNLFNGAEIVTTLLQICYAVAIGFLFTIIFYKSKSLIPCIVTHSAINSLSAFTGDRGEIFNLIIGIVLTVTALFYAIWILKMERKTNDG